MKKCFLDQGRDCEQACMAYVHASKASTPCRLLNALDKLDPSPARPTVPTAPITNKVIR